ncbi:MAG: hypothetical protein Tsb005_11090 [Gammaproteobacteria bacterium]
MQQQVNFNRYLPKPTSKWLSSRRLFYYLIGVSALLLTISVYKYLKVYQYQRQTTALKRQEVLATQRLERVRRQFPELAIQETLQKEVEELNRAIIEEERLVSTLTRPTRQQSFASYLRAIAKQTPQGLWLQRIRFKQDDIQLQGFALQAELVPLYVQQLRRENLFRDKDLYIFELERASVEPLTFRFTIGSTEEFDNDNEETN